MAEKSIYTIGHSIRPIKEFIDLLKSFSITMLADIRSYPGSRRYPQFNKAALQQSLSAEGIQYIHLPELGGMRKPKPDSKNTAWHNPGFRGYADYMETDDFKNGIKRLEEIAIVHLTAYMCSEAVWWSCHRSLVSDYLKLRHWKVTHIMGKEKGEEHPYTKPARIEKGELKYTEG
jgi:uncharacterized protein (DUF488 family)